MENANFPWKVSIPQYPLIQCLRDSQSHSLLKATLNRKLQPLIHAYHRKFKLQKRKIYIISLENRLMVIIVKLWHDLPENTEWLSSLQVFERNWRYICQEWYDLGVRDRLDDSSEAPSAPLWVFYCIRERERTGYPT